MKKDRQDADMWFTQTTARGANVKTLVANDETAFNVLNFQTYQKIVTLTDNQNGNLEKKFKQWKEIRTVVRTNVKDQKPFRQSEVKSRF